MFGLAAEGVHPTDEQVVIAGRERLDDRAFERRDGAIDERQARIVELRYFAGMSEDEIAGALGVSRSSITREWQTARAWLYRRLTIGTGGR